MIWSVSEWSPESTVTAEAVGVQMTLSEPVATGL